MHALSSVHFDQDLQIVRDRIAGVQTAVLSGLVRDLEQIVKLILVDTNRGRSEGGETFVGCVARLIDNVDVVV